MTTFKHDIPCQPEGAGASAHLQRTVPLLREVQWFEKALRHSFFMLAFRWPEFCIAAAGVKLDSNKKEGI